MIKHSLMAASVALAVGNPAFAQYSGTVFFGDSLTDSGTFSAVGAVPPGVGRFTTNPGPVWSEVLAATYGTSATPAVTGGTNFAVGGARVTSLPGIPPQPPTDQATPVAAQISTYLAGTGGQADGSTLYTVWAGANDLFFIASSPASAQAYLAQTSGELVAQIGRLQAAGARYIIVPNLPDIGSTPFGLSQGAAGAAGLTQLSQGYNQLLFVGIESAGLSVIPVDTFTLLREIVASPAAYGFTDPQAATIPACGTTPSLVCSAASLRPGSTPFNTVFADGVHPTTGAHQILADFVAAQLAAPGQISLLAESAVKTRSALTETIYNQIASAKFASSGPTRVWASLGGGRLKFEQNADFAGAKGNPYGLTIGLDHRVAPDLLVGVAGNASRVDPDFGGGGGFEQKELALSLYAAWDSGPLRLSTIGTLGRSEFDVTRDVHLGPATRSIHGSTGGNNASLALRGAFELGAGGFSHGPFVGMNLQRIDIDQFTESDGGSAALGYQRQRRTSAIGSLGYQASLDMGSVQPFGRLSVEHEFRDNDRSITAFLTSMAAPSFDLPAAKLERTWGSATLGATMKFAPNLTGSLALSSQFAQSNVRNFGAQFSLNMGF
ncbi:MAG: autotransporter domain-containing protein [Sterolibacteriaceae bacterium]|uniref:Autotransporter domain-containing protein n=1 Tax=Candidatus Methylophosphatis roskildensis TaxID=2899263 RepID=A0A9D7HMP7_9PROT|nr:autotransporter domain-containing protein [Candidatus Methylophosphatis roskildensis]MBK7234574.1 autotransporter domain-containing protein [Sterolibacteriaceae bacterium]